jgi:hypothetical protein
VVNLCTIQLIDFLLGARGFAPPGEFVPILNPRPDIAAPTYKAIERWFADWGDIQCNTYHDLARLYDAGLDESEVSYLLAQGQDSDLPITHQCGDYMLFVAGWVPKHIRPFKHPGRVYWGSPSLRDLLERQTALTRQWEQSRTHMAGRAFRATRNPRDLVANLL